MTTDPTALAEPAAEAQVRRMVLPAVSGAFLLPTMEIAVLQDGHGLAARLSCASARSLAAALNTLAEAKEPGQ